MAHFDPVQYVCCCVVAVTKSVSMIFIYVIYIKVMAHFDPVWAMQLSVACGSDTHWHTYTHTHVRTHTRIHTPRQQCAPPVCKMHLCDYMAKTGRVKRQNTPLELITKQPISWMREDSCLTTQHHGTVYVQQERKRSSSDQWEHTETSRPHFNQGPDTHTRKDGQANREKQDRHSSIAEETHSEAGCLNVGLVV